jgi:hypothetical protein
MRICQRLFFNTGRASVYKIRLTLAEADKRSNEARFARNLFDSLAA